MFDINDSRQYVSSLNFSPGESSDSSLPFGTDQWSSVRVLSQFTSQVSLLCLAAQEYKSPLTCGMPNYLEHSQLSGMCQGPGTMQAAWPHS